MDSDLLQCGFTPENETCVANMTINGPPNMGMSEQGIYPANGNPIVSNDRDIPLDGIGLFQKSNQRE